MRPRLRSQALARDGALVFGNTEGMIRHPETFSKAFTKTVARCRRDLDNDAVPAIRLHDLRHTRATLLLRDGEPLKNVSERLGHASPVITMTVYARTCCRETRSAPPRGSPSW